MPDHDTCRSKVCVICVRKATRDRKITPNDISLIKKYARDNYNINDPDFPIFCSGLKGRRPFWLLNPPSRGGS